MRIKKLPSQMGLFVNNQYVQTIMMCVTVYALIGDDIRILSFSKEHDDVFLWLNIVAFAAFVVELTLSSVGVKEYFGSFFFWLDLLSTVSIITDIEPLMVGIISLFSTSETETVESFTQ